MLKRIFFIRPLIVSVFFLLFVDVMAMKDGNFTIEQKQQFLRENILEKGYDADEFMAFLEQKKGKKGLKIENWTMEELPDVVKEFQNGHQPVNQNIEIQQEENNQEVKEPEVKLLFNDQVNNEEKISSNEGSSQKNDYNNVGNEVRNYEQHSQLNIIPQEPQQLDIFANNYDGREDEIQSNRSASGFGNERQDQNYFYELSHNNIASSFFCFYRYGGKFLASLVWSVVNSYCGFEEIVMNDWYCYAMCSGYRLQPRFMRSRVWIDMNFNFFEGIAGFLIRFFLFYPSYDMYENIFDFFNVCIDIKVYNNLYFAVNIVGIVQGVYCLLIRRARENYSKNIPQNKKKTKYVINFFV